MTSIFPGVLLVRAFCNDHSLVFDFWVPRVNLPKRWPGSKEAGRNPRTPLPLGWSFWLRGYVSFREGNHSRGSVTWRSLGVNPCGDKLKNP